MEWTSARAGEEKEEKEEEEVDTGGAGEPTSAPAPSSRAQRISILHAAEAVNPLHAPDTSSTPPEDGADSAVAPM